MEKQSGPESFFVISQVSAVEGCPLSGFPLYNIYYNNTYIISMIPIIIVIIIIIIIFRHYHSQYFYYTVLLNLKK